MTRGDEAIKRTNELGVTAPELANCQDEPPQMASGVVGKSGYLALEFIRSGQRSIVKQIERRAPLLIQRALYWDEMLPHMPCVFIIMTSGCVVQGDRLAVDVHIAPDASGHLTTQSATKIHGMKHNYAVQTQMLALEKGSYLEFIPDPVIPHCGSRFLTDTQIIIHPTATLLYSEIVMSGRKHHQNDGGFRFDIYSSSVSASSSNGQSLFIERYVLTPASQPLNRVGVMGPFDVLGNVVLLTPAEHHQRIAERIVPRYDEVSGVAWGVNWLPNKCGLIFKVLGRESWQVKEAIRLFWRVAREEILNVTLPPPFIWR